MRDKITLKLSECQKNVYATGGYFFIYELVLTNDTSEHLS